MHDCRQLGRNRFRRSSVQVAQDGDDQLVIGIIGKFGVESFNSTAVLDDLVAVYGVYCQAECVVLLERRSHLLQ